MPAVDTQLVPIVNYGGIFISSWVRFVAKLEYREIEFVIVSVILDNYPKAIFLSLLTLTVVIVD